MCGCGGGTCIPQRRYEQGPPCSPHEVQEILFSVNGECGYPLKDALREQYTGLDGRYNEMFVDSRVVNINLEVRPSMSVRFGGGFESCLQWLPYGGWAHWVSADPLILPCGIDKSYRL